MCGLEVHVEDEHVTLIRGDRDDVWSKGYLCPKGTTLGHLHHDPDRLRAADGPRRRHVARGHAGTRRSRVARSCSTASSSGTASRRSPRTSATRRPQLHARPLRRLFIGLSGLPHHLLGGHRRPVAEERRRASLMYGEHVEDPGARHPAHRLPRSCMGGNPQASQGSLLACPDVLGEIDGIRARGGKVVVDRPAPHRHRRPRRRVGADPARHRRRVPARDVQRAVRRGARRPRRRSPTS